jgi:hypothetical protein
MAVLAMLTILLVRLAALAANDDQSPQVGIVEPAFRPPQEWGLRPE